MALIKTEKEIELMRKSAKILAEIKQILWDSIKPGVSTKDLDKIAEKEIIKRGGKPSFKGYHGFTGTICTSINEELIHGIPSDDRIIQEGDLVSVDAGCTYEGWHSDSAFTKAVGEVSKQDKKLIEVAKGAFYAGVDAIKPGAYISDISKAIDEFISTNGLHTPVEFCGHGIGRELHQDPNVENWYNGRKGMKLQDGMVICIEPMITQSSASVRILEDGWTVVANNGKRTAHYEHTVAIIDGKPEILTEGI